MQLTVNDGPGSQSGHEPVDYGYAAGFIRSIYGNLAKVLGTMLQLEWNIKALQEVTLTGDGPEKGALGWHATETSMSDLVLPEIFAAVGGDCSGEEGRF
jgi:hypothetical protein